MAAGGEVNVVEADADASGRSWLGGCGIVALGAQSQNLVEAIDRAQAHLQAHVLVGQHRQQRRHRGQVRAKGDEGTNGDRSADRNKATGDDRDHQGNLRQLGEQRLEARREFRRPHLHRVQVAAQLVEAIDFAVLAPEGLDHPHAGDGLLDVAGQIRRGLLVDPGRGVERRARTVGLPQDQRHQRQRQQRQAHVHGQHDNDRGQKLQSAGHEHGRGPEHHVELVEVRDRTRHDLAGDNVILSRPVEAVQGFQQADAHPVLGVRRQKPRGPAAHPAKGVG